MHFSCLVLTKDLDRQEVDMVMAGAQEKLGWDWFQVGGRWTGLLDGYDPEKDPANRKTCNLCGGTGKRTDAVALANPRLREVCNGCQGTGIRTTWPTGWPERDGDRLPVSGVLLLDPVPIPYALTWPGGTANMDEGVDWGAELGVSGDERDKRHQAREDAWQGRCLALLGEHRDLVAWVVDYHS